LAKARNPVERSKLNPRDCEILRDTIRGFILSGEPVSSRTVARMKGQTLSAATIRNVMADLEDLGYLVQPHTSAGRVPTPSGYHFYIDSLMDNRAVPARARRYIEETLSASPTDVDQLMSSASHLLSELTHQIGFVMTPTLAETVLKAVSFVKLSGAKVLCVVVSASGFVDNKVIETPEPIDREELTRISNYLTDHFSGMTLRRIRDRLLELMSEERATVDRLLAKAIELAGEALIDAGPPDVWVEGTAVVLNHPEFSDVDRVRKLLDTFADRAELVRVISRLIHGPGVRVLIGQDSDLTSDLDFSLVATTYGADVQSMGTVGIFGPSRMEYNKVIPLVDYFGERISQALEAAFSES
jgi:heat-inducible transcriptional repressor